ncbi:MAG: UDP-N-acetylmuramoyl-tripeptide--D-alanyl-D-alanine ligase [Candidatus Omnitrophota bacterium]|jgi:UDP-N-acetylmuramoyl-tripeptide--D-alanyl-D-alanine ligase
MFTIKEITTAVEGRLFFTNNPESIVKGVSIDSRIINSEELFIAIKGAHFDGHDFIYQAIHRGAKAIISQAHPPKGIDYTKIAYIQVTNTRRALADLARFHRRRFNIPVIAITGSNGKTTTKDMLVWILSKQKKVLSNPGTQNNEIGVPLVLLKLNNSHRVAVLELGTNHFGEIAYLVNIAQPNLGIITNIGPAHLEYLRDLPGVYKEKMSLLKHLLFPRIAVLNADQPRFAKVKNSNSVFIITYGIKNKCDFQARSVRLTAQKSLEFSVNSNYRNKVKLNTIGYANIYNALAAIVAARLLGCDYQSISQRLARFVFPPGRMRLIKLKGISFIDDTYNSNPASLSCALDVLRESKVKGRRIFVMGDMLELGKSSERFHRQAGIKIAQTCDAFISVGKLAQIAAHWAVRVGLNKHRVFSCLNSRKAGSLLFQMLKPDSRDLILVKGSRLMNMEEVLTQK